MYSQSQVEDLLGKPVKKKEPKNTITFWYGGWSLNELRKMKPELFCDQSWYANEEFANEKYSVGMYEVIFCVPDSRNKTLKDQKALIQDFELCPAVILVTAALLSFLETGTYPLADYFSRCAEEDSDGLLVSVGGFGAGGARVAGAPPDGSVGGLGVAASRKFRTLKS